VSAEDRRQKALLRAIVEAVQQEGYRLIERRSADGEYALLMRRKRDELDEDTQELLIVTHELERHRVRADVYTAEPVGKAPHLARTVYRYYPRTPSEGPQDHAAGRVPPTTTPPE